MQFYDAQNLLFTNNWALAIWIATRNTKHKQTLESTKFSSLLQILCWKICVAAIKNIYFIDTNCYAEWKFSLFLKIDIKIIWIFVSRLPMQTSHCAIQFINNFMFPIFLSYATKVQGFVCLRNRKIKIFIEIGIWYTHMTKKCVHKQKNWFKKNKKNLTKRITPMVLCKKKNDKKCKRNSFYVLPHRC